MSSSDWEEVKRLAADFKRAQLTSANQRLTERNCVEIVTKLLDLKFLDVVFTTDGKEYVTPVQLNKEILDELTVHGGRLSLQELTQILNVSANVIEQRVQDITRADKSLFFVLGQLITATYLDGLCEELNEKLKQDGFVSISELSKTADLPGDFLQQQVEKRVGKIVFGKQDEEDNTVVYTETFVRRNTYKIRGILSAITKPTPFGSILNKFNGQVPERLFFAIVAKLIKTKRIDGVVSGSGNRSSYFIPTSYSRAQTQWIEGFMNGNGYVDLDAASRLGITDPRAFIENHYPGSVFLKTYCLGEMIFKQAKESIQESLESPGWVDVVSVLPLSVPNEDVQLLLGKILPRNSDSLIFESVIISKNSVRNLKNLFKPLMGEKAVKDVQSGTYSQLLNDVRVAEKKKKIAELIAEGDSGRASKKEDRRKKAAGGKLGGGTQGRETKTKSTKKKYMAGKKDVGFLDSDSEEERPNSGSKNADLSGYTNHSSKVEQMKLLPFLSVDDIKKLLRSAECLHDAPVELVDGVASYFVKQLTDDYQQVVKEEYDRFMVDKVSRTSKEELYQKFVSMEILFRLYADGVDHFEGEVRSQLEKHLLKTFGQEVMHLASRYALLEAGLDDRDQVADLPSGSVKEALSSAGTSQSVATFLEKLALVVPIKKNSPKPPSSLLLVETRESLLQELDAAKDSDPALFLHIGTLLLFSVTSGSLLQASGRFVPQIINFLQSKLAKDEHDRLKSYQDAVVQFIKSKGRDTGESLQVMYSNLKDTIIGLQKVFH